MTSCIECQEFVQGRDHVASMCNNVRKVQYILSSRSMQGRAVTIFMSRHRMLPVLSHLKRYSALYMEAVMPLISQHYL